MHHFTISRQLQLVHSPRTFLYSFSFLLCANTRRINRLNEWKIETRIRVNWIIIFAAARVNHQFIWLKWDTRARNIKITEHFFSLFTHFSLKTPLKVETSQGHWNYHFKSLRIIAFENVLPSLWISNEPFSRGLFFFIKKIFIKQSVIVQYTPSKFTTQGQHSLSHMTHLNFLDAAAMKWYSRFF